MKVLIADDHPLVRDALARTVQRVCAPGVILMAGNHAEALALVQAHGPALALVDLHMPLHAPLDAASAGAAQKHGGGMVELKRLRQVAPGTRLVVISGDDDPLVMRTALAAGAAAYVPKSEPPERLEHALALVLAGGSWLPPQALADLDKSGSAAPRADVEALTPRQTDVLRCLMRGLPNKLIARELGLTEGTVKIHIAAILRCLQVKNRTEAVVVARDLRL
jgi:DNA-binding NarL/FixJ family response regulator